jgi:hypothetical protein
MSNTTDTEINALKYNISKMRNQRDYWSSKHDDNHDVVCSLLTYEQLVKYWIGCDHAVKIECKTIIDYTIKKNGKKSKNKFHMTPKSKQVICIAKENDEPKNCYEYGRPNSEADLKENYIWDKVEKIFKKNISYKYPFQVVKKK